VNCSEWFRVENKKVEVFDMKLFALLVCVTILPFIGTGCVSYQKNRVLKQNDIRYADGTVDKSRYVDNSTGFALVGSADATRHYGSDVAVGTEMRVPPHPPMIVAYHMSPVVGSRYHYGGRLAPPSPPPPVGNRYGYGHGGHYGYL